MTSKRPSGPGEAARRQKQRRALGPDAIQNSATLLAGTRRKSREDVLNQAASAIHGLSSSEAAARLRADSAFASLPRGQEHVAWGVALAFALAKAIVEHPDHEALIKDLANAASLKRRKDTDAAMVAVRTVFDYGHTQAELNANRQYANVHANAVRHLLGLDLEPIQAYYVVRERSTAPTVLSDLFKEAKKRSASHASRPASPATKAQKNPRPQSNWSPFLESFRETFEEAQFRENEMAFVMAFRREGDGFQLVGITGVRDQKVEAAELARAIGNLGRSLRAAPLATARPPGGF